MTENLIKMARKKFTLKSGNRSTFKMMGSGSAVKRTDPPTTTGWVQADQEWSELKKDKKNFAKNASDRYNTVITKKNGVFSNPDGVSVADLEEKHLSSGEFTYSGE